MLIETLIGKKVSVRVLDGSFKGTLQKVGNHFILVDEKYINISHVVKIVEISSEKEKPRLYIAD